jgi:hypothetical protein
MSVTTTPRLDVFCNELERLHREQADLLAELSEEDLDFYETRLIQYARYLAGLESRYWPADPNARTAVERPVRVPLLSRLGG